MDIVPTYYFVKHQKFTILFTAGAKRENTFYLGSAKQPLNVIKYRLPQTGPQLGFMSVTPTANNCIPVTEILYAGGESEFIHTG